MIFKFEESAPFSYTCRSCDVPERVVFWRIGSVLVRVSQFRWSITFWKRVCVRVSSAVYSLCFLNIRKIGSVLVHVCRMRAHTSSVRPSDRSQIGLESSETKKCSQRFEIDHFCPGKISSLEPSKNGCESNRGTFCFTISISDILVAPSCSLRSFLEVGVSWAASRYSFWNLRFKHRGMQLVMWWYTIG